MATIRGHCRQRTVDPPPERVAVSLRVAVHESPALYDWLEEHVITGNNVVGSFRLDQPLVLLTEPGDHGKIELVFTLLVKGGPVPERPGPPASRVLLQAALMEFAALPGVGLFERASISLNVERRR